VASALTTIALDRRRHRLVPTEPTNAMSPSRSLDTAAAATSVATVALGGLALTSFWNGTFTPRNFYARRRVPGIANETVALAVATVGWDFIYYWNHRFMHSSRYMWAMHVVHHSSEHYNLSTALRQPVAEALTTPVPYGLLCWAGVDPETLNTARGINLLWQYWIHTETVGHLGKAEIVLNTPSAHRVHHGSQRQYLDRNHGSILIIWDRLFGTFEPERERVVYGLTKNINTFNPWRIISHEYLAMAKDVASAGSWSDRVSHVVRGPGWRPGRLELNAPPSPVLA
jgi:sterol desaturase/sphingolipid hydroxylase (fatty acid hydroxylase superfamily)